MAIEMLELKSFILGNVVKLSPTITDRLNEAIKIVQLITGNFKDRRTIFYACRRNETSLAESKERKCGKIAKQIEVAFIESYHQ